ncbi:hypothetical protein MML48_8g00001576 [Holotrichia oblita]|uniref:Uncharacterized protein n=1 Tax=Holotrichia oblita TaxID=644536 RepID=A0ACB9SLA1_HOLOL|nr:hypothetical protein MML48_8g00001576 [Holotrichia oblita]
MEQEEPDSEIKAILAKYNTQESNIDELLETSIENKQREQTQCNIIKRQNRVECLQKAISRNKEILKELEIVKSTLRSKAIYSPSEMQWDDICRKYKENPALQVTTWRCHLPVFV